MSARELQRWGVLGILAVSSAMYHASSLSAMAETVHKSQPNVRLKVRQRQAPANRATVVIDADASTKSYDPMIFGGFLEHFGRQVYGGVFEPGSLLADEKGFRLDVIEALKALRNI